MEELYQMLDELYSDKLIFRSIVIVFSVITTIFLGVGFACYYLIPNKQNDGFIVIQFGFILPIMFLLFISVYGLLKLLRRL
jgi:hypothetical protein